MVLFTSPLKIAVTLLLPGVKSVSLSIGTRISLLALFAAIVIFSSVTLPLTVDNAAFIVSCFSVLFVSFTFIPAFAPVTISISVNSTASLISRSTGNTAVISFFSTVTKNVWCPDFSPKFTVIVSVSIPSVFVIKLCGSEIAVILPFDLTV